MVHFSSNPDSSIVSFLSYLLGRPEWQLPIAEHIIFYAYNHAETAPIFIRSRSQTLFLILIAFQHFVYNLESLFK